MNVEVPARNADRRLFAVVAIVFPVIMLIGFGKTYYLKPVFGSPSLPSTLVHVHGALMTMWVAFFGAQVWLIRSRNVRLHMKLGGMALVLAAAVVVVGFFTAVAAARTPSASAPPGIPPLSFLAVPLTDILLFAGFFGAAILYRKRSADHKRLMLLTVLNFLPPAVARFPFPFITAAGPLAFFGIPALLAMGFIAYDKRQNRRANRVFLVGAAILIVSYPLRLVLSATDGWLRLAGWLVTWAA